MGQMKKLLINLIEYEDEIEELLTLAKKATPTTFSLLFDDELSSHSKIDYFKAFSNDEELIELTIAAIEFGIISIDTLKLTNTIV